MAAITPIVSSLVLNDSSANNFGTSISTSSNGTRFVVGSQQAAHIYTRPSAISTTNTLITTIQNSYSLAEGDAVVKISPDGSTVAIRFASANGNDPSQDSVLVYSLTISQTGSASFILQSTFTGSIGFGNALAFSADGNILAIGSAQQSLAEAGQSIANSGSVFIYTRVNGGWSLSSAIDNPNKELEAYFGYDVSISEDGSLLAVGAIGESNASGIRTGAVYLYDIVSSVSLIKKITADECNAGSCFGSTVSLAGNGKRLAIGAFGMDDNETQVVANENAALVIYQESSGIWSLQDKMLTLTLGGKMYSTVDIEMSSTGNTFAISYTEEPVSGTGDQYSVVRIYDYDGAQWVSAAGSYAGYESSYPSSWGGAISYAGDRKTLFATNPLFNSNGSVSIYTVFNLFDITAPTVSNSSIVASNQTYSSVKLTWYPASDETTPSADMYYDVIYSSSNNISSIALAQSNGTLFQSVSGSTKINNVPTLSVDVTNLALNSTYYFTIIARDGSGNKVKYDTISSATLADLTPPIPVTDGAPISYTSTKTSVTLTWPLATDDTTQQPNIQYAVYSVPIFTAGYTGSIATTESMGTLLMSYASNVSTYTIQSLLPGSLYGYNVIAKDASGNKVAYSPVGATTQADDIAPTVLNSTLSFTERSFTGYKITWNSASDDFSSRTSIYYIVYESSANNIATVANAEANGTAVAQFFGTDTATQFFSVTGKSQNQQRYYNVIARDAAGNKLAYTSAAVSTLADTAGPTYNSQLTVTADYNSITISYDAAQDNLTSSQDIQYALYRMPNSATDISYIEQFGTLIRGYLASTADIVVPNLNSGTKYYFALIGRDEAGNKTLYSSFSKTTQQDTVPPVPAANGFISKNNITDTGFTMSWGRATDDVSNALDLEYAVYASTNESHVASLEAIASNSVLFSPFVKDKLSHTVTGQAPTVTYYYTVVVRDERGNMAKYQTVNNRNPSDVAAPIPGNQGALTLIPNGYSAITIQYTPASDNLSNSMWLQYKIVMSTSNDISTISTAETNGTVIYDWNFFSSPFTAIVPVPGQFYFFNVLVRDPEGNKAIYVSKAGRSQVDATAPTVSNGVISLITNNVLSWSASPVVRVGWNQATDNQTSQSSIKYSIYFAPGNQPMSTVQEIENTPNVRRWTVMGSDGSEFEIPTGIALINTQYSINIVAEDSLGNKTPYSKITFTTPGDIYPPVVSNPWLVATSRTVNSIKVMWSAASDVHSPSTVQYDLYYSTSNNISTVSNVLANGTLVVSGTYSALGVAATNGYTVTGLTDSTQYYFNVIARDGLGNRTAYTSLATSTLNENIPPVIIPLSLSTGSITDTTISLTWGLGTDNKTPSNLLEYAVYRSTSQMLQSVSSIESGTKILDWTANTGSYIATGLNRNTRYFFGVVVRDQAGNKSVYAPVNALTLNDTSAPVVPGVGNIEIPYVGFNYINLRAIVAVDNVTPIQNVIYRVYRSSSNNISTVAQMISNGTYVGNATVIPWVNPYTYELIYNSTRYVEFRDSNLPGNTGFYYNIMAVDAAGNRSGYAPAFAKTSSQWVAPVVGNSGKINVIVAGSGSLNLSWSPASDESQTAASLEYAVYYATRQTNWFLKNEFPAMSNPDNIEIYVQQGLVTQASAYTQGMTSFTINNLLPATEYMVNVVVRDATAAHTTYNAARVWTFNDTNAPVPGSSGNLTTSYISDSGFVVSWNKASDDYSAQNRLRYEVRVSTQNNISTVDTFKNGTIVTPFTVDINNAAVTGLQPSTQYYVNVMVMDVSGNKAVYQTQTVTTSADIVGPTPLLNTLSFSQIGKQSMRVSWSKATDNSTFREDIEYALYMSVISDFVLSVNQMESSAILVQDYLPDTDYAIVTDLQPGWRYYFNVVAKDKFGNKTAYISSFAYTLPDLTPPTPGSNGDLLTTHVGQTSVSLTWARAVDDLSDQTVRYDLYKSLSNNISTFDDAEVEGAGVAYGLETNSYTITGLNPSSTYYFNVFAKDPRGNVAAYNTISVSTIVDTTVPSPGNSGIVNASMITGDGLTLSWTKGTDNITVEGDLQYAIYMSTSDNMNDLPSTLSNGTKIRDFAKNISVSTVSRLQPLTQYYFNVIVRDSFGNMSAYTSVSATTLADTTGPTPGGGGLIVFNSVDKDSMIVSWNQAEDNTTSGSQIQYQLRMAMSNLGAAPDFSTVAATEANGMIVKAYSTAPFALVTNLASNTIYYFNVIAKDAAGNKSIYVSASQKTANSLVEIPTQSVEVNQPVVIASNKDEIKSLPAVATHPTLSRPSNWKKVHMIYKSTVSNKRVVVVITDFSQMSGQFITRDTEEFVIHKIIVEDENNNFVAVPASSILNSQSWSISVT